MEIEIQVDGKTEIVEMEDEAVERFEEIAKERGITFDSLIALLLKSACAEAERED